MPFLIKFSLLVAVMALSVGLSFSQTAVRVDSFPQHLQLYQRGFNKLARVSVTGSAPAPYTHVSLSVLRNAAPYYYQKQRPGLTGAPNSFSFSASLRAEAIEYSFALYAHTSPTDSVLISHSERVVCGDLLILYGQSNVMALNDLDGYEVDDRLLRNFTYPYQSTDIPHQVSWSVAKQPYASVGGIGIWLQKLILEKYGIPTCVINGGVGGTPISALTIRDPSDHASLNSAYGLMLYRVQRAELAAKAKIIIYKQGEADAGSNTDHYDEALRKLTDQFEEDYPVLKKIYVSQINILADPLPRSGEIRDAQRRAKEQAPLVETIATVGTSAYDGLHYLRAGNQQIATELFRQIARDFYGATDTLQINSPNIRTACYNARRDSITLTFDDSMRMVWPRDTIITNEQGNTYVRRMIDFIYLDGKSGAIGNGLARRNQIVLSLRAPSSAQTITYLPTYLSDQYSLFYDGVHLKNERGLRAFSFDKFAITTINAPKLAQTISMTPTRITTFSDSPESLTALASSGLPVTFRVISGPGILINSHQLRFTGIGVVIVKAMQSGNDQIAPATDVVQSLTVGKGGQYIGNLSQTNRPNVLTVIVSATASSGLPITYALVSGPARLAGNTLTLSDYGQVTLRLAQAGNDRYGPATTINRTICVNPLKPIISTDTGTELVLVSSSPFRNQWFVDGGSIRTGTNQKQIVAQEGTYIVKVTNPTATCNATEQSAPRNVIVLATDPTARAEQLRVYPNPASDQIRISMESSQTDVPDLQLMDGSGRILHNQLRFQPAPNGYETTISTRLLESGIYILRATTRTGQAVVRVLIRP